jgi:hypothetical protein
MTSRQVLITTTGLIARTIAMSVYVWQLRRREITCPHLPIQTEHVKPPVSGPMERVILYVAYDDPGELRAQAISLPLASGRQQRAEALLHALVTIYTGKNSPHPLAVGSDIRDVFLVEPGVAVIDLNSAFVDGQVSGVLVEELTIASMIQTLAANIPGLTRVKILVNGNERETLAGHADLSDFYDVLEVAELAKQLSSP